MPSKNKTVALSCPICGQSENHPTIFEGNHTLIQCASCGLVFSTRVHDPDLFNLYHEDHDQFYEKPYFKTTQEAVTQNPDYKNYRGALTLAKSQGAKDKPRLLDVGCGTGILLQAASELGFQAEGLEVSKAITESAGHQFPIHIYNGDFKQFPAMGLFDVIVLWDVMEHVPQPVEFIQALKPYLAPDGVLLARTINENSLLSKISMGLYNASGGHLKKVADRMHEKPHVIYFTEESFRDCFKRGGYVVKQLWWGEFPASRAVTSKFVQLGLNGIYFLQGLLNRRYLQYVLASPT